MSDQQRDVTTEREPIRWVHLENLPIPIPFLRVTTCGFLSLEVAEEVVPNDPPLARYHRFTSDELHGRGVAPALTFLKLLLSRPQRFAPKAWLTEQFCREGEAFASTRIDNIVSILRSLLCPERDEGLRKHLVSHVRSSPGGGNGYQLAPYPLIWTDVDAIAWNGEQATRMERFGDDPLPYWERVYELARRGVYLPDEIYHDWSATRRDEVAGAFRQSVQALARLYPSRHGQAGEEEALLLLRNYWLEHPREEDVLRPLMELLGKRDCYQEALEYYDRLCEILAEEQLQPDEHTRDVAAYVRNKKIQRPLPDKPIDNGRRNLLKGIGIGMGMANLALFFPDFSSLTSISEQLTQYQEQVPFYWESYFTAPEQSAITSIESILLQLQRFSPYANSTQQEVLQTLLCQYHQLAADQLRDRGQTNEALKQSDLAVHLAEQLQHVELLAAALYRRGLTYFDVNQIDYAFRDLANALPFARISRPQLKGMIYMEAGRFQAHLARSEQDKGEATRLLDQTEHIVQQGPLERDAGYVKLNQGRYHIGRAATLLALKHPQEALKELQLAEQLTPPEYQRRHAYISILRARVFLLLHQYEQATHLALGAFHLCRIVHSESNIADITRLHNELTQSPFAQATAVQDLGFQIRHHQKGIPL